ncbi:rhomboid family intramembrane serine protease [Deinococcus arenae]|uniref:Rhomboid family intramembrane serine protease n=1 Tax=Deinococcus arenae TaxID=1452751 RepID=A0A8H9L987_9DEIO|nr:rhomboid family intramembrane serine protease [Deinococcus arenae]AWT35036.1 rhomboid family intramembrane serine protease [Deinococcus actinosclerus]GGM45874.1 rhomboid family intramembrane serine protease [Deinococcus arenae]
MRAPPNRSPLARPAPAQRSATSLGRAAGITAALIAGLWVQEGADQLVFQGQLDQFGIEPRAPGTFWHVLTAPFLHAGFGHLIANTVPLAVLTFMSALRGAARFLTALLLIVLIGGGLVWLLGRGGSVHLGASELVFGLLAYLLGVGWWERTPLAVGVAVAAFVLYGGILWGVLPANPAVSWEAHLFGFVGGLVAAAILHRKRPPARPVSGFPR